MFYLDRLYRRLEFCFFVKLGTITLKEVTFTSQRPPSIIKHARSSPICYIKCCISCRQIAVQGQQAAGTSITVDNICEIPIKVDDEDSRETPVYLFFSMWNCEEVNDVLQLVNMRKTQEKVTDITSAQNHDADIVVVNRFNTKHIQNVNLVSLLITLSMFLLAPGKGQSYSFENEWMCC